MGGAGGLGSKKDTGGGRGRQEVRDLDLVQLIADGDGLVDGREQEGFVMFVGRFL